MTLDEAIAKAKADGDVQLAEWLRQARGADAAAKWYTEKLRDAHRGLRKVMTENAKLRERVVDMHAALQAFCDAQDVHGDNCPLWVERTDDCELRGIERHMRELGVEVDDGY